MMKKCSTKSFSLHVSQSSDSFIFILFNIIFVGYILCKILKCSNLSLVSFVALEATLNLSLMLTSNLFFQNCTPHIVVLRLVTRASLFNVLGCLKNSENFAVFSPESVLNDGSFCSLGRLFIIISVHFFGIAFLIAL